jgi:hypothetical protein
MPELITVPAPLPTEPADLFTFATDRLTWQNVRDLLPLDETSRYWTIATAGPLSLLARAATDYNASLSDWTTREDSPGLFAAQDSANLWHLGLMVEVACSGVLLSHESLWACCLDGTNAATERESYEHFLDVIRQLSREACAYIPAALGNRIRSMQTAAAIITGQEEPYACTIGF